MSNPVWARKLDLMKAKLVPPSRSTCGIWQVEIDGETVSEGTALEAIDFAWHGFISEVKYNSVAIAEIEREVHNDDSADGSPSGA